MGTFMYVHLNRCVIRILTTRALLALLGLWVNITILSHNAHFIFRQAEGFIAMDQSRGTWGIFTVQYQGPEVYVIHAARADVLMNRSLFWPCEAAIRPVIHSRGSYEPFGR